MWAATIINRTLIVICWYCYYASQMGSTYTCAVYSIRVQFTTTITITGIRTHIINTQLLTIISTQWALISIYEEERKEKEKRERYMSWSNSVLFLPIQVCWSDPSSYPMSHEHLYLPPKQSRLWQLWLQSLVALEAHSSISEWEEREILTIKFHYWHTGTR